MERNSEPTPINDKAGRCLAAFGEILGASRGTPFRIVWIG